MSREAKRLPLRVLITDDSAPVAEMLRELITQAGRIEVVGTADSQASAMAAIRSLAPDAVVLDLQLKEGSGTEVIRAVRADPGLAATCLLVTSNHTSPQLKAGCLELGAAGYFDKVKELAQLAATLAVLADEKAGVARPQAS
jgi:DNA-binding NarL/FixJ family response regulator